MAGGADAAAAEYLCPFCFTDHYNNDVFFAAGRAAGGRDVRGAAFRRSLGLWEDIKEPVLLDWRRLPEARRRWVNGVIAGVQDLDGSWTDRRVCPSCHQILPPPCPLVLGWRGNGPSDSAVGLFRLAAKLREDWRFLLEDDGLSMAYGFLLSREGRRLMGSPADLARMKGSYGQGCRQRCCAGADGIVLELELGVRDDGGLDDVGAFRALEALLGACGGNGTPPKMPVVVSLEGLDEAEGALELFGQACGQLERYLGSFFRRKLLTVRAGHDRQEAMRALEWLGAQLGGP